MNAMRAFQVLGPVEMRSIWRDPMLRWMLLVPLAAALAARGLLPVLLARIEPWLPVTVTPHYDALMGYGMLLLAPALIGMVVGFLLLDQRDEQVLAALRVTPLPISHYLLYRLGAPLLLSIAITVPVFAIAGLDGPGTAGLLLSTLLAAPLAPLFALTLATLASNKVQGLALAKACGVLFIPPLVAYFAPAIWQPLLALAPTYWPAQVYWTLDAGKVGAAVAYAGGGIIVYSLLSAFLLRRFARQAD